ncbi:MAG: hypothetical protein N3B16_05930 [Candidatus Aminicenantes bacterium]|nr:hypothetical protein [Candidatus Aminicenantes bacterium]
MHSSPSNRWPFVVLLGTIWGISECFLGIYLRQCASSISGSIMTGLAFFFLAIAFSYNRSRLTILLMVVLASLFKLVDALLLSLPIQHGAVANPLFAFLMEGLAFWIIITFFSQSWQQNFGSQLMSGAFMALAAVNLFPLVKYVTGISACVVPGTNYPLSLYYAHLAISLSALTFPAGLFLGRNLLILEEKGGLIYSNPWIKRALAPFSFLAGIGILIIFRA